MHNQKQGFLAEALSAMEESITIEEALDLIVGSPLNRQCFHTLAKVCLNIVSSPDDPKFRRLKVSNKTLSQNVTGLSGGRAVLRTLGFVQEASAATGEAAFVLAPGAALPEWLVARITELLDAVGGPPDPPPAAAAPAASPPPAAGGGGGFFAGVGLSPEEREKRAKAIEQKAREEAAAKARLAAEAERQQAERLEHEKLVGIRASHAQPRGEGQIRKLFVACAFYFSRVATIPNHPLT